MAPPCRATSRPALNSASAGMALTRKRWARPGNSSVFTLATSQTAGPVGGHFGQFGRDHFAPSAPWSPELHQHRQRRAAGQGVIDGFVFHLDRFRGRAQFGAALAATESLPQTFVNQAITLAALWAGQHQAAVRDNGDRIAGRGSPPVRCRGDARVV
jgi:hypothetical protein